MGKLFSPSKPNGPKQRLLQRSPQSKACTLDKLFAEACLQGGMDAQRNQDILQNKKISKQAFSPPKTELKAATQIAGGGALRQKKIFELLSSQPLLSVPKLNLPGLRQTRLNFGMNPDSFKPSSGSLTTASHLSPRNTMNSFTFEKSFNSPCLAIPSPISFFDPEFNQRFIVGKNLGQGAFATVRECVCRITGRRAAVKSYQHELQGGVLDRVVQNEIRVLRAARHPNIIELLGVVRTRVSTHIILELFEGETLEQQLQKKAGTLPAQECRRVFSQVLAAVLYLHRQGLYHRDLKVENIMMNEQGNIKLIDFGFALHVTQPGLPALICGTPNYMAPEAAGAVPTLPAAAEVWALGVLLHRLFCGVFPFQPANVCDPSSPLVYQYRRPADMPDALHDLLTSLFELDAARRLPLERIAAHPWLVLNSE